MALPEADVADFSVLMTFIPTGFVNLRMLAENTRH
jgi:hypothetical protein